jgi:hypothetical protein
VKVRCGEGVATHTDPERFTTLLHHVSPELLRTAFFALKRQAAPGVDGMTWQAYEGDLVRRIEDLHERVHRGAYRAQPARRGFIPKADGRLCGRFQLGTAARRARWPRLAGARGRDRRPSRSIRASSGPVPTSTSRIDEG